MFKVNDFFAASFFFRLFNMGWEYQQKKLFLPTSKQRGGRVA
jgi:hypothetical protein